MYTYNKKSQQGTYLFEDEKSKQGFKKKTKTGYTSKTLSISSMKGDMIEE